MRNIKVSHSYIFFFFFLFPPTSILLIDFEKPDTRVPLLFFLFFPLLILLKEIIHRFPLSIMQKVKYNTDVFLWWILQKNTIKRTRWKTDTRHICINFSSWYFIRLLISQSSSTMSCILLNSTIWLNFLNLFPSRRRKSFLVDHFFDNSEGNTIFWK